MLALFTHFSVFPLSRPKIVFSIANEPGLLVRTGLSFFVVVVVVVVVVHYVRRERKL